MKTCRSQCIFQKLENKRLLSNSPTLYHLRKLMERWSLKRCPFWKRTRASAKPPISFGLQNILSGFRPLGCIFFFSMFFLFQKTSISPPPPRKKKGRKHLDDDGIWYADKIHTGPQHLVAREGLRNTQLLVKEPRFRTGYSSGFYLEPKRPLFWLEVQH